MFEFKDLLFKRYASPFVLIDYEIKKHTLNKFVIDLFRQTQKEKDDKTLWEYYLHRVQDDITFDEFKKRIKLANEVKQIPKKDILMDIVKKSHNAITNIKPNK